MRIFNWALLVAGVFATWTAATSKASNAGDLVLTNDGFVPRAGHADAFHRMLDPDPGTCCGLCTRLRANPIVIILLFGSSVAINGGLLNPSLLVDIRIIIIIRMTIIYMDLTMPDNPMREITFDVTVNPEDWNEPCSFMGNTCITFENDDVRLIAPPAVGGFSVLSIPNVTAFTADSNVVVVNSTCDLRCADPDVCDSIVANSTELSNTTLSPGDLEPDGNGVPFAISSTVQFINGFCTTMNCPPGAQVCRDPHLVGLQGQHIVWFGVDTRWYALFKDDIGDLHINIRITAPESDFPGHQYITGMAVILGENSLVIEVKDPYSALTDGCPDGIAPCLADGGIRIVVDGHENNALLSPTRSEYVADGIEISTTNLPPVCQEFGHKEVLASLEKGAVDRGRRLQALTFEDWILSFANMVVPALCSEMVADNGLLDVQSQQSIFRIATPTADIRLSVGINHRNKRTKKNGRQLSELDMWQMSVGVNGLALTHEGISGLLGETSRMVYDNDGQPVMEGVGALRGTVEDYHVPDALGTDFALLHKDIN